MICPQSGSECNKKPCLDYGCCDIADDPPMPVEYSDFNLFTSPPKPTMAEIERLVDVFADAIHAWGMGSNDADIVAARAALLAAIRAYGEGK